VSITVPLPPVLKNLELVRLGFMTAAYLLWFRNFGYSFALQAYLDRTRAQILSGALTERSVFPAKQQQMEPVLGLGSLGGNVVLFAAIANYVVLLPPADDPETLSRLPQSVEGIECRMTSIRDRRAAHPSDGPVCIAYGHRLVVAPDMLMRTPCPLIHVSDEDGSVQVLEPIDDTQLQALKQRPGARGLRIKANWKTPLIETGTPTAK
jgi:hypothetical protein